ncbi:MAG: YidC/Oxa1 family membrane protein insertase [bacterium]|nr:YidC/Oxa1 family membrane protein insertase [bacterium]
MNPLSFVYHTFFYQPLFNGLILLYLALPYQDLGLAIVVFVILVRLILLPISVHGVRTQKRLAELQPHIKELQEKHKEDKEALSRGLMELYKTHKVNPFSGCAPLILQGFFLFALYRIFFNGFGQDSLSALYSFIQQPGFINPVSFGFLDVSQSNKILAILAGVSQYVQALVMPQPPAGASRGGPDFQKILSSQMKYFFPFLIATISWSLPAALPLYWTVLNVFGIVQQIVLDKTQTDANSNKHKQTRTD